MTASPRAGESATKNHKNRDQVGVEEQEYYKQEMSRNTSRCYRTAR